MISQQASLVGNPGMAAVQHNLVVLQVLEPKSTQTLPLTVFDESKYINLMKPGSPVMTAVLTCYHYQVVLQVLEATSTRTVPLAVFDEPKYNDFSRIQIRIHDFRRGFGEKNRNSYESQIHNSALIPSKLQDMIQCNNTYCLQCK